MAKGFGLLLSILIIHFTISPVHALIISEVHPNPVSGSEWVELYNDASLSITLTNWWLEDQLASPSIIFHFPNDLNLAPQQYYVATLPSAKLNNDADGVTLKDATGLLIDTMNYTSSTAGKSWARLVSSPSYFLAEPTASTANPSPPSPTPSPSPSPTPSPTPLPTPSPTPQLSPTPTFSSPAVLPQASEVMACPDKNQNEWVELFNPATQPITLINWHIIDEAHNSRLVNATIPANGYQIIEWSSAMLNNTGDSFSLVEPDNTIAWTINIDACQTGQSFVLQNDDWVLTTPTPNQANQYPQLSVTSSVMAASLSSPLPSMAPAAGTKTLGIAKISEDPTVSIASTAATPLPAALYLQLHALVDHPFASPSAALNIQQPVPNLPAIMTVIISSAGLLMINLTELYFYFAGTDLNFSFKKISISTPEQLRRQLFS